MPTTPGPLHTVMDDLWARIRQSVPDLPRARIAVSPTAASANHGPERWGADLTDPDVVTGLVISADVLREGSREVLRTTLHEAAHMLCWRREVTDTGNWGRYHNSVFLRAASEVRLHWPEDRPRAASTGYADPELTPDTLIMYKDSLRALDDAIPAALPHLSAPARKPARPYRVTLTCKCSPKARSFRISPTVAAAGPIVCGVCENQFT